MDTMLYSSLCYYYILMTVIWQSVLQTQAKYIEGDINTKTVQKINTAIVHLIELNTVHATCSS